MSKKITFESFKYGVLVAAERFCKGLKNEDSVFAWQELVENLNFDQGSNGSVDITWNTASGVQGYYHCQLKEFIFYARGDDAASRNKQYEKGYLGAADYVLNYNSDKFSRVVADIYSEVIGND
jgi:N-acetylneuraminic acid mutarotase